MSGSAQLFGLDDRSSGADDRLSRQYLLDLCAPFPRPDLCPEREQFILIINQGRPINCCVSDALQGVSDEQIEREILAYLRKRN
jgi:hypothetical protein